MATDEASYAWLDEGFTSFIEDLAMQTVIQKVEKISFESTYNNYYRLVKSGLEEPATTHADRFNTNFAYSIMAYSKGTLFLTQLGYIIGEQNVIKSLKEYCRKFAFKNPTPNDFIRVAEKVSGMQLQWFLNEFIATTHTADYAVEKVIPKGEKTQITLKRIGQMPMPIDLFIIQKNEEKHYYYIPLRMQFGEKENPYKSIKRSVLTLWGWGNISYTFEVDLPMNQIKEVIIDPENISVDVDKENNFQKLNN